MMKVIKRKKERKLPSHVLNQSGEVSTSEPTLEILKEMVHTNVLAPLEIIDDDKNESVYLIY